MKGVQAILPFAALATAFVIPDDAVMHQVNAERDTRDVFDRFSSPQEILHDVHDKFSNVVEASHDKFEKVAYSITETFESAANELEDVKAAEVLGGGDHHPHDPHHGKPHHPHDPHEANLTVYELITKSKYSTKFAKLVNQFDDVVKFLNDTSANVTVFVPTDKAFEKIPHHDHEPPRKVLEAVLAYHILRDVYPAGRVLGSHTLPTALSGDELSDVPHETPQRLNVKLGFTGLFINSFSRVVYPNVFGTNGVAHAIDHILIPPPHIEDILKLAPQAFSTLDLALLKTGFGPVKHIGATLFAPPNFAWTKLGPRVNAFLFSKYGTKYLKAILEYHFVANQTLYSDAYYGPKDSKTSDIPKGVFHIELPTLLEGKSLAVDIARYGRLIELKVNAFTRAVYQDAVARDGVLQVINNVLLPPKKIGDEEVEYKGEELTIEDLKERLAPYVGEDEEETEGNFEL